MRVQVYLVFDNQRFTFFMKHLFAQTTGAEKTEPRILRTSTTLRCLYLKFTSGFRLESCM